MRQQPVITRRSDGDILNVIGTQVRFLCTGEHTGKAWSMMEVSLPRHAGPPPHDHPWDEAYFVLEGQVKFVVEGEEQLLGAGEFLYAPADTLHGFQGDSETPARVLVFDSPGHSEGFFREVDREVHGPQDMMKVPQIGERHRIFFRRPA